MVHARLLATYRIGFAALAATALAATAKQAANPKELLDFFSYFTDESNILGVLVLAWGGIAALLGRRGVPEHIRGAVVVYLMVTAVVYASLLSTQAPVPWPNTIMHRVMPVVVVLDWLLAPPSRPLSAARSLYWLTFPLAYLGYTLLRGPHADWYPYPFLTPAGPDYTTVAINCAGIAVGFAVLCLAVTWTGNVLSRRRTPMPAQEGLAQP
ncbi:MAG TPA: Pr6Pr family membrane protein [Pseudonocardiaceae bacterium]|nr:Pr6Pr family membrane protein [Pseudonocardiaceae bacterium]